MSGWALMRQVGSLLVVAGWIAGSSLEVRAQEAAPSITFFGVLRADDSLLESDGTDSSGVPIYSRPFGSSFSLVLEAARGAGAPLARAAFSDSSCPDMQIQVNRPLGNGSTAVCDTVPPDDGGVPAINPPDLSDGPSICDPLNDLGCRFVDGTGSPEGRNCGEGCVLFPSADLGCVSEATEVQFCGRIAKSAEFPPGDTLVTARVRNSDGVLSTPAQLIMRIPFPTATPTVTATPVRTNDDDSCAINPAGGSYGALLLLIPFLLWRRRR